MHGCSPAASRSPRHTGRRRCSSVRRRRAGEQRRVRGLHADEVPRGLCGAFSRESRHHAVFVHQHAAVTIRRWVRDDGQRCRRAGAAVLVEQRRDVDVAKRVAVDDDELLGVEQRQRMARSAGRAQHRRLFPRILHPSAELTAVAHDSGDGLRQMMQIDDDVGQSLMGEPLEDEFDQRAGAKRHGRFRHDPRQRIEPDAAASG